MTCAVCVTKQQTPTKWPFVASTEPKGTKLAEACTFGTTSHDVTLLNVHFEPCKVHESMLHLQFAWDISNTTEAGKLNQMNLATDSPNFPNPAETRIDALMYTAATLADPTLAAPPNDTAPVSLPSWDPKM